MIRAALRYFRRSESGFTLVEVVATVVILGIIMVPLGAAMVVGFRTVFDIQDRLANAADVQQLSVYFPQDVSNVDRDGVNPPIADAEGVCMATAVEESLVTFRWNKEELGVNGQTVVRYVARGDGITSEIVRRICDPANPSGVETVVARNFGEAGGPDASAYLTEPGATEPTPTCSKRLCFISIHGKYDFRLDAQRRVEGEEGSRRPPGAPTDVHALGGFNRARVFWDAPTNTGGLPITGYIVELNPGQVPVGGVATPVIYAVDAGSTGALVPDLTNYQSYFFRVRAMTAVGNGPWSEQSNNVTPGPTTPEPPTLDSAGGDVNVNGQVNAAWSLPTDYSDGGAEITGFKVYAYNSELVPEITELMDPAARTGSVGGLADNTHYHVQVSALNSYGEGSPSTASIDALTRPGAPGAPTATGSGTAGTVLLTFTAPEGGEQTDLTSFQAKVGSTYAAPVDRETACGASTTCTLTVTGVSVTAATNVSVRAQNATGWGPDSATLTIPKDVEPPTVAITFPSNPQYGTNAWNAGCGDAGGAICGTASDAAPGGVASVSLTVHRSSDNRYWNGSPGINNTQWPSTSVTTATTLTASGTAAWSHALTTASLQTGVQYTISVTAKDTVNPSSTPVTRTFTYLTGGPSATLSAPAAGAKVAGTVTVSGNAGAASPASVATVEFQYRPASGSTWTSIDVDTDSPYSVSWDTTGVNDGSYDLRMITTDTAGNTATSSTRTVTVDNNPPTGNITVPANGANVRGNPVTVTSNSADAGSGVATARFERSPAGADNWTTIGTDSSATGGWTVNWNTLSATPDGLYDLRVVTTDNVGLTFTSPVITVRVDNTPPTVGPADVAGTLGSNGWYTSDVNVTWPLPTDDGSGIASSTGCGPTSITANTAGQTVTCSATDNAGNSASSQTLVKVDKSMPTGSISAPGAGAAVGGSAVPVSSNSADVGSGVASAAFEWSSAGADSWSPIGTDSSSAGGWSVNWNTTVLAQGSYDLRVITTDNAGNSFTSPVRTVFVDSTPPTVAITFPVDGGAYNTAGYNAGCVTNQICGTAADAAPGSVASVSMTIRRSSDSKYWDGSGTANSDWTTGVQNLPATGTAAWNRAFTTGTMATNVTYTITATATDSSGLTGTDTHVFVYDTTNPTGSVTSPTSSSNLSGTVAVTSSSADSSGVASAVFEYRAGTSGAWTAIGIATSAPWTVDWNTTAVADGQYYLRVTTTDNAGNSFSSSDNATRPRVDNTAPTGSITAPGAGATVGGTAVAVTSNSADVGSGVASATFEWSSAGADSWSTIGTDSSSAGGWTVNWNTTALAQGSYDLRVITTDNAGNSFTSPTRTVFVDSTPPTVAITFPADGGVYNTAGYNAGCVTNQICGTAADAAPGSVASVSVTIRRSSDNRYWTGSAGTTGGNTSGQWQNAATALSATGTTAWSRAVAASNLQTGVTYTITATSTDATGLVSVPATAVFVYDATNPTGSITTPTSSSNLSGTVAVTSNSADSSGVASAVFEYRVGTSGAWTAIGTATSAPWTVDWNTTAVADGQYYLRVTTTDKAGNTFSSSDDATRPRVDNTNPTGTITAPGAGAAVGGSAVPVSSNSADVGSGVASAAFEWSSAGADSWSPIGTDSSSAGGWSVNWNTTVLAQGSYDLRVITTDNAGNSFTSPVRTVFVDSTPPTVAITFPVDGGAYNTAGYNAGCVTNQICGTAADAAPGSVASVSMTIRRSSDSKYWDGSGTANSDWTTGVQNLPATGTAAWNRAFTTGTMATNVTYTITATATDSSGLTGTDTHVFVYDTTNPTGSVTSPTSSSNLSGTVAVTSSSADSSGVASAVFEYRAGTSGAWTAIGIATSAPWTVDWNTTAVADGQYYLRVTTTDNAGNSFSSSDNATRPRVDNTDPTGTITAPANGANVRGNAVAVTSNSADSGTGVATAMFERSPADANNWATIGTDSSSTGGWSVNWNTTSATTDGLYDVRVVTTDLAGNKITSPSHTVRVDNTAPAVGPADVVGTPGSNGWYTSDVDVTWPIPTDGGSGVNAALTLGCVPMSITTNTTGTLLTCSATDNAGNVGTSQVTIKRDNTPPTVTPNVSGTQGPDPDWYRGTVNLTWTRTDPTPASGLPAGTPAGCGASSVSANTTIAGTDFTCTQSDNAGLSTTVTQNIKHDGTAPTAATLTTLPGTIGADQVFTGSGADALSGVYSISYYYCSGSSCTPGTLIGTSTDGPSYAVTWGTMPANGSAYRFRARVSDAAGNTLDSAIQSNVTVKKPPAVTVSVPVVNDGVTAATQPAITGTAGNATGDATTVTLRLYSGPSAAGSPVRTFTLTRSGATLPTPTAAQWTSAGGPLPLGQYTAQATQTDSVNNTGTSNEVTFYIAVKCTLDNSEVPADTWVDQANANSQSGGTDNEMDVASRSSNRNKRTLIRFNLAGGAGYSCTASGESGTLPTSYTARLAQLSLYRTNSSSANNRTHNIYTATGSSFSETTTWNNQPGMASGISATISTGSANGRLASTQSGSSSSFSLADDVNAFRSGTNFGWVVRDSNESQESTNHEVNYASRSNSTTANRPQLVIYYTP